MTTTTSDSFATYRDQFVCGMNRGVLTDIILNLEKRIVYRAAQEFGLQDDRWAHTTFRMLKGAATDEQAQILERARSIMGESVEQGCALVTAWGFYSDHDAYSTIMKHTYRQDMFADEIANVAVHQKWTPAETAAVTSAVEMFVGMMDDIVRENYEMVDEGPQDWWYE